MGLLTGTPLGNVDSQEEVVIEGAPYIYVQDVTATPLHNPDSNGYYWGMSGTTSYPVYALGCYQDVSLTEDVTVNVVRCDAVGDKNAIQKRNYIELTLTLLHLFPLAHFSVFANITAPTVETDMETAGIGGIDNNKYYMVYLPKVYDDAAYDYVLFHLHRCQFVDAWTINMKGGEPWTVTGLRIRAYADSTKPDSQRFGVVRRVDASAL